MLNRLFGRKKEQKEFSCLDERIVWGILAQRRLQLVYKMMAAELRVPISVLVNHVLTDWVKNNYANVLEDRQKKIEFADNLVQNYIAKK